MAVSRIAILLVAASLISAAPIGAQHPALQPRTSPPEFDVISIKSAKPGANGTDSDFDKAMYTASNVTLSKIMQYDAYGIPAPRIIGIPPALEKAAFDIQAKLDPDVYARIMSLDHDQRSDQIQQLMRQLLVDRFKLVLHTETRVLPVYALVLVKGGPKLQTAAKPDSQGTSSRNGQLKAEGVTMVDLANSLTRTPSTELGRVVIDKTGLTGRFDLTLRWTPDTSRPPMLNGEPDTSAPSIFTAIQEQLGLRLESTKAPVSVLVVDHAELPSLD
jgi:uncharacterized protein (TIGR03435 family)